MTIPVVLNGSPKPSSSSLPSSMSRDRDLFSRSNPSIAGSRRSSSGALLSLGAVPEHEHASDESLPEMPGAAHGLAPSSNRPSGVRQTSAPNGNGYGYGNGNGNGNGKGKEKEREASLIGSSVRSTRTPRTPPDEGVAPRRAPWVIDLLEAQQGAQRWGSRGQVLLVLGATSPESLAPILYNPVFSDTLVIVASPEPQPAIEALTSPSYLLSATPNSEIYPHVQPLSLSSKALVPGVHPLLALLDKAADIARSFRANRAGSKALGDRRRSSDSLSSLTGTGTGTGTSTGTGPAPLTPNKRARKLSALSAELGKRDSIDSGWDSAPPSRPNSLFDGVGAPRQDSFMPIPGEGSAPSTPRSRMSSFSRNSFVNTIGTIANKVVDSDTRNSSQIPGSAFDAVLNFITPASDFAPDRMLQDMLHGAVVITTGVIPHLVRRQPKADSVKANPIPPAPQPDVSLIHVLPSLVPRPIPALIESFLLSMLPTIQTGDRDIWASVISTPVWRSPFVDTSPPSSVNGSGSPPQGDDISGAEALLFGGVRCPHYILDGQDEPLKSRAFLGNWNACVVMPGLLCDARHPTPRPPGASHPPLGKLRLRSSSSAPLSMAYDDIEARTPPSSTYDSLLPAPATITGYTVLTQSDSRHANHHVAQYGRGPAPASGSPFDSPPVPELDASQSTRSSSSEGARTPAPSRPGTIESEKPSGDAGGDRGKKKGTLLGWFKTKTRGVRAC